LQRKAEEAKNALADLRWKDLTESTMDSIDNAINISDRSSIIAFIEKGVLSTTQLVKRILQMWVDSNYKDQAKLDFLRTCWPSLPKDDPSPFDREEMDEQVKDMIIDLERINEFMKCYP
jgi:hypothetical protein